MESNSEKIKLYAVRDFGQCLTVVMDFLRQNWKPLLVYLTYFLLPLSMVQALSLNGFMGGYMDFLTAIFDGAGDPTESGMVWFLLSLPAYLLLYFVGTMLMYAVTYGLMRLYERGEGRLENVGWQELKPHFMFVLKRSAILLLVGIVALSVFFFVIGSVLVLFMLIKEELIVMGYMLLFAALVFLVLPLSLIMPTYMFEDGVKAIDAIKKGFRLGFGTYWLTIGVLLVLGFVINLVSQFTSLPWMIMLFVKMLFGLGIGDLDRSVTENVFFSFGTYLSGVLQCFGGYVCNVVMLIGSAYLYGHAAEKLYGQTIEENIRNFNQL